MGKYEWMMVTFVPDNAGVGSSPMYRSNLSGPRKDAAGIISSWSAKSSWSQQLQARLVCYVYSSSRFLRWADNQSDLTPAALSAHLKHLASPPPLSAAEAALAEVRAAEAAEAKRAALDPEAEARRKKAVVGLGGKLNWGEGVEEALRKCGERSDDGWIVCLVGSVLLFVLYANQALGNPHRHSWCHITRQIRILRPFCSGDSTAPKVSMLHLLLLPYSSLSSTRSDTCNRTPNE